MNDDSILDDEDAMEEIKELLQVLDYRKEEIIKAVNWWFDTYDLDVYEQ